MTVGNMDTAGDASARQKESCTQESAEDHPTNNSKVADHVLLGPVLWLSLYWVLSAALQNSWEHHNTQPPICLSAFT
jgi:hypothetical protein